MNENKPITSATWTDPDDAPELTEDFFEQADLYQGETLIRRGRPKALRVREQITIRLSPIVLDSFRATGPGWQTRMDAALADWLKTHRPDDLPL